ASLLIAGALLLFGGLVFGLRFGQPLHLVAALIATACCYTGLTMLLSTLGKTEEGVSGMTSAVMLPMSMLGGGMIPLMAMPGWMAAVSNISPVKWGILALEGAIWRDFSWTELLLPCGVLIGIGAVCFGVGVWVLSRRE